MPSKQFLAWRNKEKNKKVLAKMYNKNGTKSRYYQNLVDESLYTKNKLKKDNVTPTQYYIQWQEKQFVKEYNETVQEANKMSRNFVKTVAYAKWAINDPLQTAMTKAKEKISEKYWPGKKMGDEKIMKSANAAYVGVQTVEVATNAISKTADFAWNRYCTLSEDYMSQQAMSNVTDTLSRVKSGAASIIGGAVSGATAGGAIGAVVGAVGNAATFGFNQYMQYQQRMSNYYQQLNATNLQTNYDASRLGLTGSSGTEN